MAYLNGSQIKELALKEIAKHPEGIGPTGLLRIIHPRHPDTKDGTIRGAVWKLEQDFPATVIKISGQYFIKGSGGLPAAPAQARKKASKAKPEKPAKAKPVKAERPKASAKAESQEAELRRLNAELAKVQKIVCGA